MTVNNSENTNMYEIFGDHLNYSSVGIIYCTNEGTIKYINDGAFKILSLDKSNETAQSLLGENILDLINGYKVIFEKVLKENYLNEFELYHTAPDDSIKWILNDAFIIKNDDSQIYITLVLKDISKYKHLELEYHMTKKIFSSLMGSIPDVVYSLDSDGIITYINDTISKYGYDPENLIGTCIYELIHPDDREGARYHIGERRTGERKTKSYEVRLLTKGRDIISFDFAKSEKFPYQYFLINSEGVYLQKKEDDKIFAGSHGVAQDIQHFKAAEKALVENEESWRSIIDSLDDGYCEIGLEGTMKIVNTFFCQMTGYERDELVGKSIDMIMDKTDPSSSFKQIKDAVESNGKPNLFTWSFNIKDMKKRKIESSMTKIKNVNGEVIGYRGIVRDITSKNKIEEELIRARKLEAIGILSGGIAHDYNNALTAILGNISLAKMYITGDHSDLVEVINDAEQASLKVMDLTKRLSNFARGGKPLKKKVSVAAILDEVVEKVLKNFNGIIRLNIQDGLTDIEVDDVQIRHVLENIVENAQEASPEKGTITINAQNITTNKEASLHEISLQPGNYVMISIIDQGKGIPQSEINSIFDPYYTTKDFSDGMGLAISYAVIKRHKGYIDVLSDGESGARFDIYLPLE